MLTILEQWNLHAQKRNNEAFFPMRYDVLKSPLFKNLSSKAKALLFEFASQYTGYNNGDFSISYKQMKQKGWHSPITLDKAKNELLETEFLILTRQGGRNQCSLFALSFLAIDECQSKLDIQSTKKAPDNWKKQHYQLINQSQVN